MTDILGLTSQWKSFFSRAETVSTVLEFAGRVLRNDLGFDGALVVAADDDSTFRHRFRLGSLPPEFDRLPKTVNEFQRFIKKAKRTGDYYRITTRPGRSTTMIPLVPNETEVLGFAAIIGTPRPEQRTVLALLRDAVVHSLHHLKSGEYFTRQLDQLSALLAINNELATTFELGAILALINRKVKELGMGDFVDIGILDPKSKRLNPVLDAKGAVLEISQAYSQLSVKVGNGVTGQATLQGRTVIVRDVRKNKSYMKGPGRQQVQSEVAIPLKDKNRILGVINYESNLLDAYGEDDIRFLESLANQAAIAIRNAQLFTTVTTEQNKLASILAAIPDPVLVIERDGSIVSSNPAAENELGLASDREVGTILESFIAKDDLKALVETALTRPEEIFRTEASKGGRVFDLHISALRDGNGTVMLFVDITRQKELDQARADFTAMLIHDLRAPLSTIIGTLDFALDTHDNSRSDTAANLLENARNDAYRMLNLIQELLGASRLEAGRFELHLEPTSIVDLIEASLKSLQNYAREKGVHIHFWRPEEPVVAPVDRARIIRVLINVIENSIKYSPNGGTVLISAGIESAGSNRVARVKIADNGCGIPADDLPLIFDRYRKVRGHGAGYGLGLTVSKLIIEAHKGRIWVESAVGKGCSFYFTVPLKEN